MKVIVNGMHYNMHRPLTRLRYRSRQHSPRSVLRGRVQLLKVFVIGKIKKMITEGHELCKRTGIRISEVGNYRPGKQ